MSEIIWTCMECRKQFSSKDPHPCTDPARPRSPTDTFEAVAAELLREYPEEPEDPPGTISNCFGPCETRGLSAKERVLIEQALRMGGPRSESAAGSALARYRIGVAADIRRLIKAAREGR